MLLVNVGRYVVEIWYIHMKRVDHGKTIGNSLMKKKERLERNGKCGTTPHFRNGQLSVQESCCVTVADVRETCREAASATSIMETWSLLLLHSEFIASMDSKVDYCC